MKASVYFVQIFQRKKNTSKQFTQLVFTQCNQFCLHFKLHVIFLFSPLSLFVGERERDCQEMMVAKNIKETYFYLAS